MGILSNNALVTASKGDLVSPVKSDLPEEQIYNASKGVEKK